MQETGKERAEKRKECGIQRVGRNKRREKQGKIEMRGIGRNKALD